MSALVKHWDAFRVALDKEKLRAQAAIRVDESAFLPAALEIVERPVSPTARLTAMILIVGVLIAIAWLILGRIDVVASATGRLIPADNVKVIQAADTGVVRTILVRDNQRVRAGQALLEFDPTFSSAEVVQAGKALQVAELDAARGRAMLSALDGRGLVFVPPPGTPPEVASVQSSLAAAELESIRGEASMHGADKQVAMAANAEARLQAAKLNETLPIIDQEVAANELLLSKGFVSKLRILEMRRQRLSVAKDRDIAVETARKAQAQIASATGTLRQANGAARAKVLDTLAKAESEVRLRREELVKASRKSSLQRLTSPVDGIVSQLAVHTVGGVVEMAKPIMVIVPDGGELIAEAKVQNKDIGFVRIGQPVSLKLAAFPFTRYGTVAGVVDGLSSDAVQDEKLGLVYTARVKVDRRMIQRNGQSVVLTPGMEVIADIRTGRRSIMSYLLSPIQEAGQDAGHER